MPGKRTMFFLATIVLFLSTKGPTVASLPPHLCFSNYTVTDGLAHSIVLDIEQDQTGFMWIATGAGLSRFDGYGFRNYKYSATGNRSLYYNNIKAVKADHSNTLWLSSNYGLDALQIVDDQIRHYFTDTSVSKVFVTPNNTLWIIANRVNLYRFNHRSGQWDLVSDKLPNNAQWYQIFASEGDSVLWLAANRICRYHIPTGKITETPVLLDIQGDELKGTISSVIPVNGQNDCFWVSSNLFGLSRVDISTRKVEHFSLLPEKSGISVANQVNYIWKDPEGLLWLTTEYHGIQLFAPKEGRYLTRQSESLNQQIGAMAIGKIFVDQTGCLWLTTFKKGLFKADLYHKGFRAGPGNPAQSPLKGQIITAFAEDERFIWVGTWDNGLYRYDQGSGLWHHFTASVPSAVSLANNNIGDIGIDPNGNVWILSWHGVITVLPKAYVGNRHPVFHHFWYSPATSQRNALPAWGLRKMLFDNTNRLWVATQEKGIFSFRYNVDSEKAELECESNSLKSDELLTDLWTVVRIDNNLLAGTDIQGMGVLDLDGKTIKTFRRIPNDPGSISNNSVRTIFRDSRGRVWVGTADGLNEYLQTTGTFHRYNFTPLVSNIIYGILEDSDYRLWISTDNGLYRFDPQKRKLIPFNTGDGLPSEEFTINAFYKLRNGQMMFGTNNGLAIFDPATIRFNPFRPSVAFTSLTVQHQTIEPGISIEGSVILHKDINSTEQLILNHYQNNFSIEFSALHYANPAKNSFWYRLEGYQSRWAYVTSDRRIATFTNLPAGNYTLRVKAGNNDGLVGAEKLLKIKIIPPWWKTIIAKMIYIALLVTVAVWLFHLRISRLRKQHSLQIERISHQKELEINEIKLRFFTNISHELRTPLTLIISPLKQLIQHKGISEDIHRKLSLMYNNADHLLHLIGQLLDFRKMEKDKLVFQPVVANLTEFIREIFRNFEPLAAEKSIELRYRCPDTVVNCSFDPDMIHKALYNLLSNAIKYTLATGKVNIDLSVVKAENEQECNVCIVISDTGLGIPAENLPFIFERFYQVPADKSFRSIGTGIGLSLTKEFVEIHQGTIGVESQPGIGTRFTITLPLRKQHIIPSSELNIHNENVPVNIAPLARVKSSAVPLSETPQKVLIVEDNHEMRHHLIELIGTQYSVYEADNGESGLALALATLPDLVISDIMMYPVDGTELCRQLKLHELTSHIPIILLTAISGDDSRLSGIRSGADDYITKPFTPEILLARVKQLIDSRQQLAEKWKQDWVKQTLGENRAVQSNVFIEKALRITEENLQRYDFGVKELASEMGMSQVQFYRKVFQLTNQTPSDLIRNYRLQKAAEMLLSGRLNISEVVDNVGFKYPSHFAKCFKELYGKTPSEFIRGQSTQKAP